MVKEFIDQYYFLIIVLAVLDLSLKAVALWKAARQNQKWWFISLLVINSAGILPLIYIKFSKKKN